VVQEVDPPTSEVDPNQEIQLIEIDPEPEPDPVEEAPFTIVEDMPEFPGGEAKLYEFLAKHTKYPPMAKDAGIQGIVYLSFVVEKDGSISSIEVLRGIGAGCDEESVRVLKKMPKWVPGKQRGKTVRVNYRMPFRYKMKG
jgi:protein TonB